MMDGPAPATLRNGWLAPHVGQLTPTMDGLHPPVMDTLHTMDGLPR